MSSTFAPGATADKLCGPGVLEGQTSFRLWAFFFFLARKVVDADAEKPDRPWPASVLSSSFSARAAMSSASAVGCGVLWLRVTVVKSE